VLCGLLFLAEFRNREEELNVALTNTKWKVRDQSYHFGRSRPGARSSNER
jgi:hypothetical protein